MPIGDVITSGATHSIVAADLSENVHNEAFTGYFLQNSFSRILLNTTATSIDLVTFNNIAGTGYPAEVMVVVNGVYHSTLSFGSTGAHTFSGITFSAGAKVIEFSTGFKNDPSGTIQGMWLTSVTPNQNATIVAPATVGRILFYGDSIVSGAGATSPVKEGFIQLLRAARPESIMAEAWGYRGLYDDAHTTPLLNALVANIVASQKAGEWNLLWIEIGTNDHGLPLQSAANFGTQYAAALDAIHAALPNLPIVTQTMFVKTSEGANGYGNILEDYRDQVEAVAAPRAYCLVVDGSTILTTGDLADGIHPSTSGHVDVFDFIDAYLDAALPVAAFSVTSPIDCGTSCIPTNTSTAGTATYEWRVNGTLRSTAFEPELATYLLDGTNTIHLTVTNLGQTDSVSHDVTVDRVTVNRLVSNYTLGSLVEGVTLFGRVRSVTSGVPSGYTGWKQGSLIDTVAPTVPVMNTPTVISGSEIDVSWSASTDLFGVTNYDLQYSTSSLFTSPTTVALGNVLSHNVTGLAGTTLYYFRVRAKDGAGNASAYSASENANTSAATITLVAHAGANGSGSNAVTGAIDTTGATLLVVAVAIANAGTGTLTDSKSNTWVALTAYQTSEQSRLYYCKNPTVGSGHTFTYTTAAQFPSICVAAFNNTDITANADGDTGNSSAGSISTIQPGSLTPSANNSVVVTAFAGVQTATASINSGFTISDQVAFASGTAFQIGMAYKVQTTAAAVNPTWDLTATINGGSIATSMSSFKHS